MITRVQADRLMLALAQASDFVDKVDALIRNAILTGTDGRIGEVLVGDGSNKDLAELLAARCRDAGWITKVEDIGRDRAYEYSVEWHVVLYR